VRFTYAEAMTDPTYYIPLAKAAEEAGYHAMTIADSLAPTHSSRTRSTRIPATAAASSWTARSSSRRLSWQARYAR
jgi:alkanesulfonate monooxygenase SsuD/methylene tetrahydromethanopterin reductase-like flavin-dependent oxidoreductase (luciferase family)